MRNRYQILLSQLCTWLCLLLVGVTTFNFSNQLDSLIWIYYLAFALGLLGWILTRFTPSQNAYQLLKAKQDLATERQIFQKHKKEQAQLWEEKSRTFRQQQSWLRRQTRLLEQTRRTEQESTELRTQNYTPQDDISEEELRKDEELDKLIREQAELLFQKVKSNEYHPNNPEDRKLFAQHMLTFIENIALVYRPESKRPLLETSIHQLLKAVNRTSLQLLTYLDQLPLDVKEYNINKTYGYVQTATKAYSVYKNATDYWDKLSPAYYLGRVALGANPMTLALLWLGGKVATSQGKRLFTKYGEQYALGLLNEVVKTVGQETANIYDANYRYRDAYWIYGVELTELLSKFPFSPEALQAAIQELSALQLRSEYDRIYLYRQLAQRKTALTSSNSKHHQVLSDAERETLAKRLEKFYQQNIFSPSINEQDRWIEQITNRLGIQLRIPAVRLEASLQEQTMRCVTSCMTYIKDVKNINNPKVIKNALEHCKLFVAMAAEDQAKVLVQETTSEFTCASIAPESTLFDNYIQDLIELEVRLDPYSYRFQTTFQQVAQWYRIDYRKLALKLDKRRQQFFVENLLQPSKQLTKLSIESIENLQIISRLELVRYIYLNAAYTSIMPQKTDKTCLLLTDSRALLVRESKKQLAPGEFAKSPRTKTKYEPKLLASALLKDISIRVIDKTQLEVTLRVSKDAIAPSVLTLKAPRASKFDEYFAVLKQLTEKGT